MVVRNQCGVDPPDVARLAFLRMYHPLMRYVAYAAPLDQGLVRFIGPRSQGERTRVAEAVAELTEGTA
jgi:hypothetical protein